MHEKRVGLTTKATAIIVIVILVVVGAVGAYYLTMGSGTTPPSQRGTIKVGFTISQTGTFNVEGGKSLAGIEAATKWINDNGGVTVGGKVYNITLDYRDDGSVTTNLASQYASVIQDGSQFLLAPYSSGLTAAVAPLADQNNLIMLSHGGAANTIFSKGYHNVFQVLSPASAYLATAIDYLKANHPGDKLAFLYANDAFSALVGASASNYAKTQGFDVVYNASYPSTVTDLSPQLKAAQAAGADDILGGGHYNDGLLVMQQLKSIGWTPKFISLLVAVTEPAFQQALGTAANLVSGPSQWESTVNYSPSAASAAGITYFGPTVAQFLSDYAKYDSAGPSYHSGEAGASIIILADAIEQANSLDTAQVAAALHNLHIMTFFGQFQVSSTGLQIAHAMVLDQWQSGTLEVVAPSAATSMSVEYPYTGS